jgi:hypothetical protein
MVLHLLAGLAGCSDPLPKSTGLGSIPTDHPPTDTTTEPGCAVDEPSPYAVDPDDTCADDGIGTFDPVVEWTWSANPVHPEYHQVVVTPAVVDLSGDGTPDIVFVAFHDRYYGGASALTALDGADGSTLWSVLDLGGAHPTGVGGIAAGDLDGDGRPEIVVPAVEGLLCVDADGELRWLAAGEVDNSAMPAIGDLEGDGLAEIVVGRTVYEHDGAVRWVGTAGQGGGAHPASFPVDLDGDGLMEVIAGSTIYEHDGAVRRDDGLNDGKPAVADFDGDGVPEIVVGTGSGELRVVGLDGTVWWNYVHAETGGGAPTVADFDGDGAPEVGVANGAVYSVVDTDGTLLWSVATRDQSSALTGSSAFDFDGDGTIEVVYADEETLWVFDGATGAVELQWDSHSSGTLHEYPVIADVDLDGSAEIIVASNDYAWEGSTGITVIGDANGSWRPARPIWNQHAYMITNVDDDGSVPAAPAPNWATWNSFRTANLDPAQPVALSDLAMGDPWACTDECDADVVHVWLPVENRGSAASGPVTVTVSTATGASVAELELAEVPAGSAVWAGPVALGSADFADGGLVLDVAGAAECDLDDNARGWASFPCP